jgi:hypothetical protein
MGQVLPLPAPLRSKNYLRTVLVGVMLARFFRMMRRMDAMSMGYMRMMSAFFVIACFVMAGGFTVVLRRVLVVFGCFGVVLGTLVARHREISFWALTRKEV